MHVKCNSLSHKKEIEKSQKKHMENTPNTTNPIIIQLASGRVWFCTIKTPELMFQHLIIKLNKLSHFLYLIPNCVVDSIPFSRSTQGLRGLDEAGDPHQASQQKLSWCIKEKIF